MREPPPSSASQDGGGTLEHLPSPSERREWLERLPRLIDECAEQWELELGPAIAGGECAYVAPAGDVVLKVGFPHEESEHEALALRAWKGQGAVRLIAEDAERHAMLLERCIPGTELLSCSEDPALDVVASLLPRLWTKPPPEVRLLSDLAARWVEELPESWKHLGRPIDSGLLDEAVDAFRALGPSQGPLVLANEDLHAGNILRAEREPWLVIDPKPVAAERDFTAVAMIRDRMGEVLADPRPLERVRHRLERLSADLGLDRERMRGWAVAHTVAWGFHHGGFFRSHAEIARLLVDA